jgi:hypothetical protein
MDNFDKLYPNYNAKLSDLLSLDDIPYSDKAWLAIRVAPLKTLQQWSVECAEYALENFEKKFPNDNKVRDCIEVTKKVINGELEESAVSAAQSAAESAVSAAQLAAESTAESTAWWAAESAAWWAAESTVSAARSAAESAEKEQQDINLSILIALLKNEEL